MTSYNYMRLCVAALLLCLPAWSWAHRLDAAASFEDGALVIEAWFADGSSAPESEVTITDEEGNVLETGEMDAEGFYRWPVDEPLSLTINVYAGRGHNQMLTFTHDEMAALMRAAASPREVDAAQRGTASTRERSAVISTQDRFGAPERVVLGLTFILAAAAAWLSYRNSSRLRAIQESIQRRDEQR